jgi:hypothetical protein
MADPCAGLDAAAPQASAPSGSRCGARNPSMADLTHWQRAGISISGDAVLDFARFSL